MSKENQDPKVRKEQTVNASGIVESKYYIYIPEYNQEVIILEKHIPSITNQINKLKTP
jgi:hypothetical protein